MDEVVFTPDGSKSVVPHGTVGSNPTASANKNKRCLGIVYFYFQIIFKSQSDKHRKH